MTDAVAGATVAGRAPAESVARPGLVQRSSGFALIAFKIPSMTIHYRTII
jgi:hypothetical protein